MTQIYQLLIFAGVFLSITGGVHYYLWVRMIRDAALPSPWREIATVVLILLWLSLPAAFALGRFLAFDISRIVTYVPYVWLGTMMLFFFAFLSFDLVKLLAAAIKKLSVAGGAPVDPERRKLFAQMAAGAAVLTVSGMAGAGVARAARKPAVKRAAISLARLPKALDGFRIVQISDLHIGITVGREWLDDLVRRINALKPDLIAITGDLVDGSVDRLRAEVAPLSGLSAPHGVYFVTGNHEYYSGAPHWVAEVRRQGVRVLRNESVPIARDDARFFLAGVDDYASRGMAPGHGQDIPKALANVPADEPTVLLAHQPKAVIEASERGVDLVLSGHTHGGQIWPFNYFVGLQQPYNKGLYRHSDRTQIYVNQGTFLWGPPMRLGTECEITEIELKSA